MSRIAVAAALWFAMVAFGWEILVSVADVPRFVGPVLAVGAALWIFGQLLRVERTAVRRPVKAGNGTTLVRGLRGIE